MRELSRLYQSILHKKGVSYLNRKDCKTNDEQSKDFLTCMSIKWFISTLYLLIKVFMNDILR